MLQFCFVGKRDLHAKWHWNMQSRTLVIILCKSRALFERYYFLTLKWNSSSKQKIGGWESCAFQLVCSKLQWWSWWRSTNLLMCIVGAINLRDLLPFVTSCLPWCTAKSLDWSGSPTKNTNIRKRWSCSAGFFTMVCIGDATCILATCVVVTNPVISMLLSRQSAATKQTSGHSLLLYV